MLTLLQPRVCFLNEIVNRERSESCYITQDQSLTGQAVPKMPRSLSECAVFILCPTSVRIWYKTVFRVGLVAEPKPNRTGSFKNASGPDGIPLFWGCRAINPSPPKSVKSWGADDPLRPEVYPVVEHARSRAPYATRKGAPARRYLPVSPTGQCLTQGLNPEGRLRWG